ncbi:hypothetical protein BV22DRAFT_1049004 [Leucogyrophana mollusca]|uniref:Uncharacterized protein n=1 Tax=Leucogyrophana mollusca TaxID=85980 RepID=A0ACB8BAP3_9AGAM|nr:hypothetical protein BV22DRAFT_1049004 [Leucogyrophana mollusca]
MDPYVEFAVRLQTVNYFEVSIASLFTYDYLYNLEDEITLIWKENGWGLGKVLFVLVRYIPFAMFPLSLSFALPAYVNVELCAPLFFADIAALLRSEERAED